MPILNNDIESHFWNDSDGNPSGGSTVGVGLNIQWQQGLVEDNIQNGAFIEDVILAAVQRLEFYQKSKFNNIYNTIAVTHLLAALTALDERTRNREVNGVLNTYYHD